MKTEEEIKEHLTHLKENENLYIIPNSELGNPEFMYRLNNSIRVTYYEYFKEGYIAALNWILSLPLNYKEIKKINEHESK